jgi:hypothetical protein
LAEGCRAGAEEVVDQDGSAAAVQDAVVRGYAGDVEQVQ